MVIPQRMVATRRLPTFAASPTPFLSEEQDDGSTDENGYQAANITSVLAPLSSQAKNFTVEDLPVPSLREIIKFCLPAMGVFVLSPLLSMMDTSTVGIFAGTLEQAALNPATAVTDYSARALSFLYTGATHMMASADDDDDKKEEIAAQKLKGALHLAFWTGTGLSLLLLLCGNSMLRGLIGNDQLDPAVFQAASRYVSIRALGMPMAALVGTAQASCLGRKDTKSPLRVILLAGFVNLVLDVLLVRRPEAWMGGAAGAAWATIASQYAGAFYFMRWFRRTSEDSATKRLSKKIPWKRRRKTSSHSEPAADIPSTRGILSKDKLRWRNFLRRPPKSTRETFAPFVGPVTTTQVGRCSTYVAMGYVVSSTLDTLSMAANQIITSIFYTLIPVADSLSLTAQSFLPSIVAKPPSPQRTKAIQKFLMRLLKIASGVGLASAGVVACIPWLSHVFTTDVAVMALMREIVPILFAIFSLHGVFCGSEGILLAQRDLSFLGRMYAIYFAVVPYLMLQIPRRSGTVGLKSVWNLFLGYQLFRIGVWVTRVGWLFRRASREGPEEAELLPV